jgi:phage terminase large subunit
VFIKTPKQVEATDVMGANTTTLLEGGARSGKTAIIIRNQVARALHYPNTLHLAARLRYSHARSSLWMQTIPGVMQAMEVYNEEWFNNSDLIVRFPNGSQLICDGLDDKKRVEKILGKEYASIFLNEVSQLSFDSYEIVTPKMSRCVSGWT